MNNQEIKSIVLGKSHSFYIDIYGDLYGCGMNHNGQLGISNKKNSFSGNIKSTLEEFTYISSCVKKVCTSEAFTIIQDENGKLFKFGNASNKHVSLISEIKIKDVVSFGCGSSHNLFLKRSGEVWAMGSNESGQCGFKKDQMKKWSTEKPVLLMYNSNVVSLCCGYDSSYLLVVNNKGKTVLNCFGRNYYGQLGLGNTEDKFGIGCIETIPNISSIHCGSYHTLILTSGGEVYSCGMNSYGQLGLGNNENYYTFTKTNLSNIAFISPGDNHSVFMTRKREIFSCGLNNFGQLGSGDYNSRTLAAKLELLEDIKLIQNQIINEWSKENYKYFDEKFQHRVFCFLICLHKIMVHSKNNTKKFPILLKIPKPVQQMILSFFFIFEDNNLKFLKLSNNKIAIFG
eukprot:TRINITY_DN12023_c0_g1_i1.p1 TRINITY_DN12023_c0_g1~~TRINITY_DN12023_c0_g1_i1.p1  ORF type:complete len:429 (-),score=88.92 TRINITY_DN12023_c0_g1_i1:14-1213(-)